MVKHTRHTILSGNNAIIIIIMLPGNHANSAQEVNVYMRRCAAYEITSLAKKKVDMKSNPAYEQVRVNL